MLVTCIKKEIIKLTISAVEPGVTTIKTLIPMSLVIKLINIVK